METLKKIFPMSFKEHKGAADLVIGILIYIVVGIIAGALIWLGTFLAGLLGFIGAIVGWALGVVGAVVDLYILAGIIIEVLAFCKVLKE